MPVVEDRYRGARELRHKILLRAIHEHEIRPQADDSLDVRIEQRTDARQIFHLWRVVITAHGRQLRPCADGEEHVCERWHQGDYALRWRLGGDDGCRCKNRCQPEGVPKGDSPPIPCIKHRRSMLDSRLMRTVDGHAFLTSNHMKNGPPMTAVTTPTGSSIGAMIVRATRSHKTRNAAPNSEAAGKTMR